MTDPVNESGFVELAADLLTHYSFDLAGQTVGQLVAAWMQQYPSTWLRAAVVEALYQGRYKAISVEKILTIWSRRRHPICHFNLEFERMVCAPVTTKREDVQPIADELNQYESCAPTPLTPEDCMSHHFDKAEQLVHSTLTWDREHDERSVASSRWEQPLAVEMGTTAENPEMQQVSGEGASLVDTKLLEDSPEEQARLSPMPNGGDPQPIHKFVPQVPRSPLHERLQAMVSSDRLLSMMAQNHGASDRPPALSSECTPCSEAESLEVKSEESLAFNPEVEDKHLSHVQLATQSDLEAIANALEQETFGESHDILLEVDYPLDTDPEC